jgi:hypothetical protein
MRSLACLLVLMSLAVRARADEAQDAVGRRVPGALALDAAGRLRFTPSGKEQPPEPLAFIRVAGSRAPLFRTGAVWRVHLSDGQRLTGSLIDLDGDALRLRTSWGPRVEIPRAAAASLTSLPGQRLLFLDDFTTGLEAWQKTGSPVWVGPEGKSPAQVRLEKPDQSLTYRLSSPLEAGEVSFVFEEPAARAKEGAWDLELLFGAGMKTRFRVTLAGSETTYQVDAAGLDGTAREVKRGPGPRQVQVRFGPEVLRVTCDDAVLWYNLERGPGGPLRSVAIRAAGDARSVPALTLTEVAVLAALEERRHAVGSLDQDEVWTAAGDQLFGRLVQADRQRLEIQTPGAARPIPWSDVRGCFFGGVSPRPALTQGAHVRLGLRSGLAPDEDLLEGVLRKWDERVILEHARLGRLEIERSLVSRVWPRFFGERRELATGLLHLGPTDRLLPGLPGLPAPVLEWRATFPLEAVPEQARLVVRVVQLASDKGGGRSEVVVNGQSVGSLERVAGGPVAVESLSGPRLGSRELMLTLPASSLKKGENTVHLRQVADRDTGRVPSCVLAGIILEMPR